MCEIKEEMEFDLGGFRLFSVMEFRDRIEYAFWKRCNLNIKRIRLHKGQRLKWFSKSEIEQNELAFGFNEILAQFFKKRPL